MAPSPPFTILVAGCGVGGLTFAKALLVKAQEEQLDIRIILLERRPEIATTGHGLTLFEGAGILRRLGVPEDEKLNRVSSVLTRQVVSADDGSQPLVDANVSDKKQQVQSPFAPRGIRRPDLVQLLAESLQQSDAVTIHLDWQVVTVQQDDDNVTATNQRGETLVGDMMVGFDGIGSKVRQALQFIGNSKDEDRHREFGRCCVLLGTAKLDENKEKGNNIQPPGTLVHHFDRATGSVGVYSGTSTTGNFAWTIGYRSPTEPEWNADWNNNEKALAAAQSVVEQWATLSNYKNRDAFQSLLAHSTGCLQLGVYTQSRSQAQQPWSRGRLVTGGDAAHAVLPLLGEGANLAMADAVVLARHVVETIQDNNNNMVANAKPTTQLLEEAFGKYEAERRGPSQSGLAMTKALRPVMLSQNWIICKIRNLMMGHMVAANWNGSHLRGQDAFELLDRPMQDRNPHANLGSNIGMVVAHLAVIGGGVALAIFMCSSSGSSSS